MGEKKELTKGETAFLAYASGVGNISYNFTFITSVCGRSFWVAVLIGVLLNIPFALWILQLGKLKRGTIFDLLEIGIGRIFSRIIIIIYFCIYVAVAVCMLNFITGTTKIYFLQYTPASVIMFIFVLLCAVFVNSGMNILAKLFQILAVFATLNYFLGFIFALFRDFHIEYVFPVFDTTIASFSRGVLISVGTVAESLLFLFAIVGLIPKNKEQNMSVVKGLVAWSVVLSLAIIILEGCSGSEMLSHVAQAGVAIARLIEIKSFIRGVEILIFMTYHYIAVIKIAVVIYSCQISLNKFFNARKGKLTLIFTALAIYAGSIYINSFNTGYYLSIFLGSFVILPFVVLVLILVSLTVNKEGADSPE